MSRTSSTSHCGGSTPYLACQGWSALPQLPCPRRPTPKNRSSGSKESCRSLAPFVATRARINRHVASAICRGMAAPLRPFRVVVCTGGGLLSRPAHAGPQGRPPVHKTGRTLAPPMSVALLRIEKTKPLVWNIIRCVFDPPNHTPAERLAPASLDISCLTNPA